ncbi:MULTISPECIES: hypothetical protein [Fusobacterium]|jgi:hypothetical protein|uniref:Uncharacterized protein n=2 Tax=Fusobacterium mortiferum TaxID=850 RepID=A0ABN5J538_FUSMR|nr:MULTISPECIES: hypothetical protein [Fusobacterium]AVQ17633.1 hypothetical protein C4N19_00195 [Fusobacterium mortiferum ATCC 9817]EEO35493.2 hypothetical protein FMAG_01055 [Fusobacterium mortiferum ATCC 9817]MCF2700527.1 hypothetical protein [Fusobacterium mortiferum]MCI6381290.1 hypothetical protein [Fusobacterium mortiferum]MCI7665840.1 hypothetical protein [Fusobacterium mortiferum]
MEYIKIISGVLAIFIGYHKFILSLLDRKIDKEIWEREKKLLERLEEENRRNMLDGIKRIEERMVRIEEKLMK